MLAGLVTDAGRVLASRQVRTRPQQYLPDLLGLIGAMVEEAGLVGEAVSAVGVGTTGFVDRERGVLSASMTLGLSDVPIAAPVAAAHALPVFVDNDIHAAALGELRFGVGREHSDFLVLNAGTGLAVGLVFGGRLYRGAGNVAGEVGHTSVDQQAPACDCGLSGCLEDTVRRARDGADVRPVRLGGGVAPDTEVAYLALGVVNLVNLLNPSAVVLVGGRLTADATAVRWLVQAVRAAALPRAVASLTHIGVSQNGTRAGLLGAAALAYEGLERTEGAIVDA